MKNMIVNLGLVTLASSFIYSSYKVLKIKVQEDMAMSKIALEKIDEWENHGIIFKLSSKTLEWLLPKEFRLNMKVRPPDNLWVHQWTTSKNCLV